MRRGWTIHEVREDRVKQMIGRMVRQGMTLPRSIEDGAKPPADLSGFEQPTIVVVIPFVHTAAAKAAA